jgi:6-pyruvoyl-tetrahydropterin synthase
MEKNKTVMQDFLENIRNKKNAISRDVQNGHGHYYVIRIFEILEAEAFSLLEKEKEQIKDAYGDGLNAHRTNFCNREEYYNETYGK